MKVKKPAAAVLALLLLFAMMIPSVSAMAKTKEEDASLNVVHISDTHILPGSMIKDTPDYDKDLNSDRKMFTESDSIVDTQLEKVVEQKPDVLVISGDLTKDGERQAHKALAAKLRELKKKLPNLKIYVINGNHDVNNKNGKNFNTADGKAVAAERTSPQQLKDIYADITYKDPSVIATFAPKEGKQAGQLSYVARPKKGYTIIAIDSCRYSADNTKDGTDEHLTSGQISLDLEAWVLEQIQAAKARGDMVLGLEHHGLVPHFTYEPVVLPQYLLNDYDRLSREFADAGMHFVFTGHMHAQDVSKLRTDKGNDLYDMECGSSLTYPSPIRVIQFRNDGKGGGTADGSTIEHLKVTFRNPLNNTVSTIPDLNAYGKSAERGINEHMMQTTVNGYLEDLFDEKGLTYPEALDKTLNQIIHDLLNIEITDQYTLIEFINYTYQTHLDGTDNGQNSPEFEEGVRQLKDGKLLDEVVTVLAKDLKNAPENISNPIIKYVFFPQTLLGKLGIQDDTDISPVILGAAKSLAPDVANTINGLLLNIVESFTDDTNYPDDLEFHIVEKQNADGSVSDGKQTNPAGAEMTDVNQAVQKAMAMIE